MRRERRWNSSLPAALAGLCVITPEEDNDDALAAGADAALRGGASALQYRRKKTGDVFSREVFFRQARRLQALCKKHGALFIINDDVDAAKQLAADGVHLGANDAPLLEARRILGDDAILGATCGSDINAAQTAAAQGADYVAFGAVFPSTTKPAARHCPLTVLAEAKKQTDLPLVAVGGITAANIAEVAAVADCAAVCAAVFSAADVFATAAQLRAAFFASASAPPQHQAASRRIAI